MSFFPQIEGSTREAIFAQIAQMREQYEPLCEVSCVTIYQSSATYERRIHTLTQIHIAAQDFPLIIHLDNDRVLNVIVPL